MLFRSADRLTEAQEVGDEHLLPRREARFERDGEQRRVHLLGRGVEATGPQARHELGPLPRVPTPRRRVACACTCASALRAQTRAARHGAAFVREKGCGTHVTKKKGKPRGAKHWPRGREAARRRAPFQPMPLASKSFV